MRHIRDIPDFDKPREKLAAKGPQALSDTELLAVILGKGVKGRDVFRVARDNIRTLDKDKATIGLEALISIGGVGIAKAC